MNCPFCKTARQPKTTYIFKCDTWGLPQEWRRSNTCYEAELTQLHAALDECQANLRQAIIQQDDLLETVMKQADELAECRSVCAEAYQLAGACNAPEEVLDNLIAATRGEPMPHETFLPVVSTSVLIPQAELDALRVVVEQVLYCRAYKTHDRIRQALSNLDRARETKP